MKTLAIFVIYWPWADGSCSLLFQTSYEVTDQIPVMKNPYWCFLHDFESDLRFEFPLWVNLSLSPIPWKYHHNICHRCGALCVGVPKDHWFWQQGDRGIPSAPKFLFPTCPVLEIPVYLLTESVLKWRYIMSKIHIFLLRNESTGFCRL